ncbi:MAG TPA: ChbG/HpnK family deacetylase [Bryobacteraceae bacterium]|nr:ChbG/HpnK family deacetylase [Bryobacteraceae bacterium]
MNTIPTNPATRRGLLIVNADDWGRDTETTDSMLECLSEHAISSVSAMVFMEDSARAAEIALMRGIDAGLHLNFTTPFSASRVPNALLEHHRRISAYLRSWRLAQVFFHPGLVSSFEYVVRAQCEEYARLYRSAPRRLDGHHHMHLCANVTRKQLLPTGTLIRRNFSFIAGEKTFANRLYRRHLDNKLARRHTLTDFLFSLPPMEPVVRIDRIIALARQHTIELETHPVKAAERQFLLTTVPGWIQDNVPIASRYELTGERRPHSHQSLPQFP